MVAPNPPDPNVPDTNPPDTFSSGSKGLASDVQLPVRTAKPSTKNIELNPEDIVGVAMPSTNEITSARAREIAGPTSFGYVGQNLVNSDGTITRGQYDPSNEAYSELARMPVAERLGFLNSLKSRGLYGSSSPSTTGFDSKDLTAMGEFLRFANAQGVTADVAQSQLLTMFPAVGSGRTIRTTAKADIRAVFQNTTRQLLGRDLSQDEIEKFVKAYEGKEITEGSSGVKAPSIANAAEETVQQQFGGEAQAMGMANLMDILDKKIKGLA
jgi:hypothetical protein